VTRRRFIKALTNPTRKTERSTAKIKTRSNMARCRKSSTFTSNQSEVLGVYRTILLSIHVADGYSTTSATSASQWSSIRARAECRITSRKPSA
jgi:chromosome condensin MukBEF complex kleisin-like MukF subunit